MELAGIRESILSNYKMNRGRAAATTSVARALAGKLTVDVGLTPQEIDEHIREHQRFREFMESWWPMLDAPTALARLADRELLDELAPHLTTEEPCRCHCIWGVGCCTFGKAIWTSWQEEISESVGGV